MTTPEEGLRTWSTVQGWKEWSVQEQDFELAASLRDWQHILLGSGAPRYGDSADEVSRLVEAGLATAQERGFRAARWTTLIGRYPPTTAAAADRNSLCALLRDLFGNPFRPLSCQPDWLRWHEGLVAELADAIYAERAFDRLPIVADALEDAGCTDAAILDHCRAPGPHVRGCWVVDLLLGKE
jgi:hypothetical protein